MEIHLFSQTLAKQVSTSAVSGGQANGEHYAFHSETIQFSTIFLPSILARFSVKEENGFEAIEPFFDTFYAGISAFNLEP